MAATSWTPGNLQYLTVRPACLPISTKCHSSPSCKLRAKSHLDLEQKPELVHKIGRSVGSSGRQVIEVRVRFCVLWKCVRLGSDPD